VIEINPITGTQVDSHVQRRDVFNKISKAPVATDAFLRPEYKHVSAVLYGMGDWTNRSGAPGPDFIIVHNPMAETPLPDGWFPSREEYWWREGDSDQPWLQCKSHG
jgi:hypothetical protein